MILKLNTEFRYQVVGCKVFLGNEAMQKKKANLRKLHLSFCRNLGSKLTGSVLERFQLKCLNLMHIFQSENREKFC